MAKIPKQKGGTVVWLDAFFPIKEDLADALFFSCPCACQCACPMSNFVTVTVSVTDYRTLVSGTDLKA